MLKKVNRIMQILDNNNFDNVSEFTEINNKLDINNKLTKF